MKANRILSVGAFCTALLMCASIFAACGSDKKKQDGSSQDETISSGVISDTPPEEPLIRNPLTGEAGYSEELLTQRPVAVMINNINVALPQSGIADADIVYEMPVEGPITRLMAVFSDYKSMPNTGSIRSARHDYVELVKPLNAIYLHFGGSDAGKKAISDNHIDNIDGTALTNVAFYMDKERAKTRSSEHCWFSDGELVQAGIDKKGYDTKTEELADLFQFAKPGENVMEGYPDAKVAADVVAPLTGSSKAAFSYDANTKLYSKWQNNELHMDTNKNGPVQSTNVFLMYTNVGLMADQYHKEIDMSKGTGYYLSAGKAIEVTFEKKSINDKIQVFGADGKEIMVNTGKTYFCVADNSQKSKVTMGVAS